MKIVEQRHRRFRSLIFNLRLEETGDGMQNPEDEDKSRTEAPRHRDRKDGPRSDLRGFVTSCEHSF